jgi:hypothetical protein
MTFQNSIIESIKVHDPEDVEDIVNDGVTITFNEVWIDVCGAYEEICDGYISMGRLQAEELRDKLTEALK